jgi:hypothetical protein
MSSATTTATNRIVTCHINGILLFMRHMLYFG